MSQITVTQQEGYLEFHFAGAFDDESLYQTMRDLWMADDYEPTHNELHDLRHADFTQVTGECIRKTTDLNRRLHADAPQLQHAMLANDDFSYGLSRMTSGLSGDWNATIRVFRDREEAIAWVSSEGAHPS